MAHGNLPGFPSLLGKQKRPLVPLVAQILDPEPGDGPDAGSRINERPQDRPVPKPEHRTRIDRGEELPGLLDGHLGGLSVSERIPDAANGLEGIEHRRVPADQRIEEVAQSGQGLVLVGGLAWELLDEAAGGSRRDLPELESVGLAPGQKLADRPGVRPPGVGVRDLRGEELVGRKTGGAAGAHEQSREGRLEVCFGRRVRGFEGELLIGHFRIR